ncbi:MAG TPA: hypothetical protein VHR86_08365, partial [Armatimonadota bacterium]|nr:hypothetical protein [Armatimonadota bacterium]
ELMQQPKSAHGTVPPWTGLAWVTRVGTVVTNDPAHAHGADLLLPLGWKAKTSEYGAKALPLDPYAADTGAKLLAEMRKRGWVRSNNITDFGAPRFQSETGELTVDGPADMLILNTPRSAGGYAPAGKTIKTDAATIAVEDTDATVWVSSVDGAPIRTSRRLLITHLTDMQNTSARYGDKARQVLLSWGKLPHLARNGRATVTLKMKNPERAHVWGLATSGMRLQEIPTRVVKGALVIPLAINADGKARMLYEVAVE